MNRKVIIVLFGLLGIIYSCAVQKAPLGGPRDETPPVLDTLKSTPNFQTNFDEEEITLRFDEFIQLKNAFSQIVYSPPFNIKPEITQRGKKVTIEFSEDDSLRTNTTYTINFGDAIQDFNEGNPISNFRFVFSTGDVIDSLEINGKVINDEDGKPAEEVLVMLYDQFRDSIVIQETPYYFSKTDEDGNFQIQNIRSDSFKLFILKDENLNLKFDEGEAHGYLDSAVFINDSLPGRLELNIFQPTPALNLMDIDNKAFKLKLEFNGPPESYNINNALDSVWWKEEIIKDSLILWHDNQVNSDSIFIELNGETDTFSFKKISPKQDQKKLRSFTQKNISNKGLLPPGEDIIYEFNLPIYSIDTSKIALLDSISLKQIRLVEDSMSQRKLRIGSSFRFGDSLQLVIPDSAIVFIDGSANDSITPLIIPEDPEKYGKILLTVDSLDQNLNYVLELKDGNTIIKSFSIRKSDSWKTTFEYLKPKQYDVRIVQDDNNNGRWDPGNYFEKRQSEGFKEFKLEALRANWELESTIQWKTVKEE